MTPRPGLLRGSKIKNYKGSNALRATWSPPPGLSTSLSEQKINDNIKLVCEQVSKNVPSLCRKERTLLTKTERELLDKGKRVFEFDDEGYPIKPRWELVCCHTARRTAITNMYLSGKFSTRQIMSVSGHKKEETFLKYIRLSLDEKADDVASAAFDGLF